MPLPWPSPTGFDSLDQILGLKPDRLRSLLGSVNQTNTQNWDTWAGSGGANSSSSITNSYNWHSGAVLKSISNDKDGNGTVDYTTTMTLGLDGTLQRANISDGTPRVVTYANDGGGQVLKRDEALSAGGIAPHDIHYRFGGKTMGKVSNNGTNDVAYETSVDERTDSSNNSGPFRNGNTYASPHADFDQFYNPVNSYQQSAAGGSYTVRTGDTLSGIAAGLYGDSSLWYKIAEANGLSGDATLTEGTILMLPAGVMRNTHNATTFQPYDPSKAIGDVSPTTPEPPKDDKNCGVMGQILLAVVAVAVTVVTAGAALAAVGAAASVSAGIGTVIGGGLIGALGGGVAGVASAVGIGAASGAIGSIASQGVGVATGIQDKFSWKAVGMAALGGGVGAGLGGTFNGLGKVGGAIVRGATSNIITQGVGVVTGLQDKFSWTGVAAAGVGAGFGSFVGGEVAGKLGSEFVEKLVGSSAGAIANAATRSAIDGSSFGDNIVAAIPDVIGQALGNAVAKGVGGVLNGLTNIDYTAPDVNPEVDYVVPDTVVDRTRLDKLDARAAGSTQTIADDVRARTDAWLAADSQSRDEIIVTAQRGRNRISAWHNYATTFRADVRAQSAERFANRSSRRAEASYQHRLRNEAWEADIVASNAANKGPWAGVEVIDWYGPTYTDGPQNGRKYSLNLGIGAAWGLGGNIGGEIFFDTSSYTLGLNVTPGLSTGLGGKIKAGLGSEKTTYGDNLSDLFVRGDINVDAGAVVVGGKAELLDLTLSTRGLIAGDGNIWRGVEGDTILDGNHRLSDWSFAGLGDFKSDGGLHIDKGIFSALQHDFASSEDISVNLALQHDRHKVRVDATVGARLNGNVKVGVQVSLLEIIEGLIDN